MSHQLINRSADLKRLRDEGYSIEIRGSVLVVRDIPYVNAAREVKADGILVENALALSGDATTQPTTHVIHFAGEKPCDEHGQAKAAIYLNGEAVNHGGLTTNHQFSSKPMENGAMRQYHDYYEKIVTYERLLSSHAQAINPSVTAKTFRVVEPDEEDSVFHYLDTASSRAGIVEHTKALVGGTVVIIGLGGTGSYVLDFVAKTPVAQIDLFDSDPYLQHNAFRSPGAPSLDDLRAQPKKVEYLAAIYSKMRKGIVPHPYDIEPGNLNELNQADFVFVCIDSVRAKKLIVGHLLARNIPFVDVGMGIQSSGTSLMGLVRTTTATSVKHDHLQSALPFGDGVEDDQYQTNIQIADLNALNAALAVIKWKKLKGFYLDQEREHHSVYMIGGNYLINENTNEAP